MTPRAAQPSHPAGTAGQPPTAPPGGGFTPTRGRGLPSLRARDGHPKPGASPILANDGRRPGRWPGRVEGIPHPAPGLTRGPDPKCATVPTPPREVPPDQVRGRQDQVRDGRERGTHAPGPTRGPDPRCAATAPPREVPDQVRDGQDRVRDGAAAERGHLLPPRLPYPLPYVLQTLCHTLCRHRSLP